MTETKHILEYINYDVIGVSNKGYCSTVSLFDYSGTLWLFNNEMNDINNITLVLRSVCNINKVIKHNTNTFIPLLEIANVLESLNCDWKLDDKERVVTNDKEFCFFENSFIVRSLIDGEEYPVFNQLKGMEMLKSWCFDLYGLIDKNEAIDYNALKNKQVIY